MSYNNNEPYDGEDGQPPTPADNDDDHGAGSPFWNSLPTYISGPQNTSSFTVPNTSSGWPIPHPEYHPLQSNYYSQPTFPPVDLQSTQQIDATLFHPTQQLLQMSPSSSDLEFQFPSAGVSSPAVSLPEGVTPPSVATTETPPPEKPKRKRVNRYKNASESVLHRRREQNRCSQRAYRERKDQRIKELEVRVVEQDDEIRQLKHRLKERDLQLLQVSVDQLESVMCYPNNERFHYQGTLESQQAYNAVVSGNL
ncbi:hypothetical protein F4678DRAFT_57001 [Xylaria arbuscula]|nr:hypothetical protein F4678DRAFT_57001 [Xylaria arbuscula]